MNYNIYIGTYSKGEDKGLFFGELDINTGDISLTGTLDIENPSYLQVVDNRLYGVSELGSFEGKNGGALFSVDLENHQLLSNHATHGKHPCHLTVTAGSVYVANYTEGSLSIFFMNHQGEIQPSHQSIHHFGKSVNLERQKSPHIHFVAPDPTGEYLAICDLGLDKVFLYPCLPEGGFGVYVNIIECPPGAGPRHLTFSKDGKYLYILTELGNTILVYEYEKGNVNFIQEISTLPLDFAGESFASAIHLLPSGDQLAISNRGHDSIAIFDINNKGTLTTSSYVMTPKNPRDFSYSPCGNWLLVASQDEDLVMTYKVEKKRYTKVNEVNIPKPVCIKFK